MTTVKNKEAHQAATSRVNIDRRRSALQASPAELEKAKRLDKLESIHLHTDQAMEVEAALKLVVNRSLRMAGEGRCLMLLAESGAGKTHELDQFCQWERLQPTVDQHGPRRPLVRISAPSPTTMTAIMRTLYFTMVGKELPARANRDEVRSRLMAQLYGQCVSIVVIDEFHHVLNSNPERMAEIVNTLKALLLGPNGSSHAEGEYPIQLVLAGMKEIQRVLNTDLQLSARTTPLIIGPYPNNRDGLTRMKAFLKGVLPQFDFTNWEHLIQNANVRRFMIASSGFNGRVMRFLKEGAILAIDEGAEGIDRIRHLVPVFRRAYPKQSIVNPFEIEDPTECPKVPMLEYREPTRLRGKAKATAEEATL